MASTIAQTGNPIGDPTHAEAEIDHSHDHHKHVIVPPITLATVLAILLAFTALTVGIAQFEVWIMSFFDIELPRWVNVVGAMSIATIKAVLVMAYFMQLRYDNPVNSIAMLFCFFAVGLFLFFSSLDLFTRTKIYDFKGAQVVTGGTGVTGKPIVQAARDAGIERWGPDRFAQIEKVLHHKHAHKGDHAAVGSTADASRPITGLTGALGDGSGHGGVGGGHGSTVQE